MLITAVTSSERKSRSFTISATVMNNVVIKLPGINQELSSFKGELCNLNSANASNNISLPSLANIERKSSSFTFSATVMNNVKIKLPRRNQELPSFKGELHNNNSSDAKNSSLKTEC